MTLETVICYDELSCDPSETVTCYVEFSCDPLETVTCHYRSHVIIVHHHVTVAGDSILKDALEN